MRRDELLAHAMKGGIERLAQRCIRHLATAGDTGSVAADACEYQAHTPATFSSIAVVMV